MVNWGSSANGLTNIPAAATNIAAIDAGWHYNVGLRADGKVIAWGINRFGNTNTPIELTNVVQISANIDDTVARIGDGLPVTSAVLSNVILDANGISLCIPSQSGRVYRLEYKNSLAEPVWTPLRLVAGTGADLTLTDAAPISGSERFYRVRRW